MIKLKDILVILEKRFGQNRFFLKTFRSIIPANMREKWNLLKMKYYWDDCAKDNAKNILLFMSGRAKRCLVIPG
jgi:hypothetical protein